MSNYPWVTERMSCLTDEEIRIELKRREDLALEKVKLESKATVEVVAKKLREAGWEVTLGEGFITASLPAKKAGKE